MNSVERLILEMIGEDPDAPDVFADTSTGMAQIRDSINDAIEEITIITGGNHETFYLPLRESRAFYRFNDLGGDVAWITDAWLTTQRVRLEQSDIYKLRQFNPRFLYDSGPPRAYAPVGLSWLMVWPKPSSDTDILEITAVMVPERYTEGTDRIKLRTNLEWAAAHFAVGEYYASRGDAKQAVEHHTLYMRDLGIEPLNMINRGYSHNLRTEKEYQSKASTP